MPTQGDRARSRAALQRAWLETLTLAGYEKVVEKQVEAALCGVKWAVLDINNRVLGRALPGSVVAEMEAALDEEPSGPAVAGLTAEEAEMVEAAARIVSRRARPEGVTRPGQGGASSPCLP
jgi:hypothetical protein